MLGILLLSPLQTRADEGMWLFNRPPIKQVEKKYGFRIEQAWLDHLQKSSVRFNTGGSGSFISKNGLLLTNHHVGAGIINSLSTAGKNLMEDGFLARDQSQELPCNDLELNVLMSIRDVTAEVEAVVTDKMSTEEAVAARRAIIAKLQEVPSDETATKRRDVVTLYQGGAYHLYEYRRYSDVRLVFAPERRLGAFGGDPDNFEFPRYCLDCCFFRAYENGKPAVVENYLKWNRNGARDGELVFVSGHPGTTNRELTQAQVERMRDNGLPYYLERSNRKEVLLSAWSEKDKENKRRALGALVGTQNGRKARTASLHGLLDPKFMETRGSAENEFRESLKSDKSTAEVDEAFATIEKEINKDDASRLRFALLGRDAFDSTLFGIARTLVQAADESLKPDAERLAGFNEARRKILELGLFSDDPVYKDFEILRLADSLAFLCNKLGSDDPTVKAVLGGLSPARRAEQLVNGTALEDIARRKALYEGGKAAVDASADPMILLARMVDGEIRRLRKMEEASDEVVKQAHAKIAKARFALAGESRYPDATFSLRLSVGRVTGIPSQKVPFHTTYDGLFARSADQDGKPPFDLPESWKEKRGAIGKDVAMNFISTNDITGGNSGSPIVDRNGELVGVIFDGNFDSLVNNVAYDEKTARAVSVDSAGIWEALDKVYGAENLLDELNAE
ncbi:S46 family peptidase [Luteolibacter yonseiensis]|uniref:Dipeptidyl-peptidase n=2 Tax=Luteolibacter yonseiensis TaxID=1144680 RepID=A0A934R0Y5_9BACT|nr:S46 family peptidase [Luteolibacter yonseiensis]